MIAKSMPNLLLAGDVGGTKTLLGLFEPAAPRPRSLLTRSFGTLEHADLPTMIRMFMRDGAVKDGMVTSACFGVAGPVIDQAAALTNVVWHVDAREIARIFALDRVRLLNDLVAMAHALPVLEASELQVLQQGTRDPGGNLALIAAGTGLGEALVHNIEGQLVPSPSEAGHGDFAARTEREIVLLRELTSRYGRADVEHVISGRGLVNIHRAMHREPCAASIDLDSADAPALITTAAVNRSCPGCVETLDLFVEAYGAEAGNLALRSVATGGVFIGGGIAPKILPALAAGGFMQAFRAKSPLDAMVADIPVNVILNPEAGLLGAAAFAGATRHS
ncbi:MAG TPA: glucokinase [Vicinamibacterales bacterium]|jgi:glucokinase